MGEARLRFGTQKSADVKLFLAGPDDKKYEKNPVHLHSQILKRLKGFEGKFSERWSPVNIAAELWVTTSHNFDEYLKCIEIMYGEPGDFLNIEECLAILTIASEMWADECINKCMEYLEAVRWSAEEESQIRKVLSSEGLKLKISPDLGARLHQEDDDHNHMIFVEKSIKEMVSLIECSRSPQSRETVEKDLIGMLDGNASRDVVDVCGRVVLQEFEEYVNSRYLSCLMGLFKLVQHCNRGILEAALKTFCENAELIGWLSKDDQPYRLEIAEPVFDIVTWFMKATGEGKILISRASRVSLLKTWLPILGKLKDCHRSALTYKFVQLDRAVLNMVESLPQVDQKSICLIWAEVYRVRDIDIATPFTMSKSLQHAHTKSAAK